MFMWTDSINRSSRAQPVTSSALHSRLLLMFMMVLKAQHVTSREIKEMHGSLLLLMMVLKAQPVTSRALMIVHRLLLLLMMVLKAQPVTSRALMIVHRP